MLNAKSSKSKNNSLRNYYSPTTSDQNSSCQFSATAICNNDDEADDDSASSVTINNYNNDESIEQSHENLVNIAQNWGVHRFETHLWAEHKKPVVKLAQLSQLEWDSEENAGVLSDRMVGCCLSYLDQAPEVNVYACCRCVITEMMLKDISVLQYYHYLQYLDLSHNELTTLGALKEMPFLMYLDVSFNNLEYLLDFKAPLNLTFANYSHNFIMNIGDLSDFWSLVCLDLSHNNISNISGLDQLKYLTNLDLSYNLITQFENVTNMQLNELIINNNTISKFNPAANPFAIDHITSVNFCCNALTSLKHFRYLDNIETIAVAQNNISSLLEISYLKHLRYLVNLNLKHNPLTNNHNYQTACLQNCGALLTLDEQKVDAEKFLEAKRKFEFDPRFRAINANRRLGLLEQINRPQIGAEAFLFDTQMPIILAFVEIPGSNNDLLRRRFCEDNAKFCIHAINHTTRSKSQEEIDGYHYYFVTLDEFNIKLRNGDFISEYEYNGHKYGLARSELAKCLNKVLVVNLNISSALALRLMGYNPTMILALPRSEETHLSSLKNKYFFHKLADPGYIKVQHSPVEAEHALRIHEKREYEKNYRQLNETLKAIVELIITDSQSMQEFVDANGDIKQCWEFNDCDIAKIRNSKKKIHKDNSSGILKSKLKTAKSSPSRDRVSVSFKTCEIDGECMCPDCKYRKPKVSLDLITSSSSEDSVNENDIMELNSSGKSNVKSTNQGYFGCELSNYFSMPDLGLDNGELDIIDLNEDQIIEFLKWIFIYRVLVLDLHWTNPGLFAELIFTDEEEDSLKKLHELLKQLIQHFKYKPKMSNFEKDANFQNIINMRLDYLRADLRDEVFEKEQPITCNFCGMKDHDCTVGVE